jgi:hypothetical protein
MNEQIHSNHNDVINVGELREGIIPPVDERQRPSLLVALTKCVLLSALIYGTVLGSALLIFTSHDTWMQWVGAAWAILLVGLVVGLVGQRCYKSTPESRATCVGLLQIAGILVAMGVTFVGVCFGNALFAFQLIDTTTCWTTLVILCLQVFAGWSIYTLFSSPEQGRECTWKEGLLAVSGVCTMWVGLIALCFWVVLFSPMPALDWMAPVSILAVLRWIAVNVVPGLYQCAAQRICSTTGRSTQEYDAVHPKNADTDLEMCTKPAWNDKV